MPMRDGTAERREQLYREAMDLIASDYARDLQLEGVARTLATSRRQLQRAFAEIGDTSFRDELAKVRMHHARALLAADVQILGDGGGKAPALVRGVVGADNVARVLAATSPLLARIDARVDPRELNGQPGAILRDRDGSVVGTVTLDVLGGRIQTVRWLGNPDKLGHVGPVADGWAFARELKQARGRTD